MKLKKMNLWQKLPDKNEKYLSLIEGESYFVILVYHKIKSITKDTFWKLKSVEDKILLYKEYKLDIFNIL